MKKLAAVVFFSSILLLLIGLVMVLTASSAYSSIKFDNLFTLFNSHVIKVIVGIFFMGIFCFVPYEIYKEYSKPAIFLITLLLVATLIFAPTIKGSGRWINLGFISFQPADAAKLFLIIHLARLIDAKKELLKDFKYGFMYLFIWVIIIASLIILQPNISNAILLIFISLVILYVGGAKFTHILSSSVVCIILGLIAAMIYPHSRGRILSYINSIETGGDINIQVKQALLGLGSGGIFGIGMGHSRQSNLFLPEAYGDFIFAILGEELGFIGSVTVLTAYLILFTAGILIAKKAKDTFGQLLAFGITFSILVYAFINISVSTGLIPTTGLPLPFISYGGTSLIFLCISIGILINIAWSSALPQNEITEIKEIEFERK
jgi:cell division protein FtsW